MEVFNLFSRHIPQRGLARIDRDRDRQGIVPDMKITLTSGGVSRPVLHEIKVISSSKSRYKPSWKERGVDKRADQLHEEYLSKARKVDQDYGGVNLARLVVLNRNWCHSQRLRALCLAIGVKQAKQPISLCRI